jgi:DNA end-binding protein Ku
MRATWRGDLKLSLVSVPVEAFNAQASGKEYHFNQLHAECHSRIRYKKVCPIHGEVTGDEIISGYEYAKGQFAVIDPEELDQLRTENDKAITIEQFISPAQLDPLYLDGRSYYLVPHTSSGTKAYAVLLAAMKERDRAAIARVVFSGKEQLVVVRPTEELLTMSMLSYEDEVRQPSAFSHDLAKVHYSPKELQLAEMLIDASTVKRFDLGDFTDLYTERVTQLIETKLEGREVTTAPETQQVSVINLMDALRKSIDKKQPGRKSRGGPAKPKRRKHA